MKTYKFYTKNALLKDKDILSLKENEYVVICGNSCCVEIDPIIRLLNLEGRLEIVESNFKEWENDILKCGYLEDNEYASLLAAIAYDNTRHPDETVFVTSDSRTAAIANLFFGEDSIILLED